MVDGWQWDTRMEYFGHYNDKGEYIGFFTKELHGDNIPSPTVVLSSNEWQEALSGDFIVKNGKHVKRTEAKEEILDINVLRTIRNLRLIESDWTQLPDVPLSEEKRKEWREYRQKLRDITKPENISSEFPIEP
jgi:hypothetical protein